MTSAFALNWSMAELTRRALGEWLDRHAAELRKAEAHFAFLKRW